MKNNKRIIAFMLSIVVLMGAYTPVEAEESKAIFITDDGFTYTADENNEITITGYTGTKSQLVVPGSIDNKKVIAIGEEAFINNKQITEIVLSENIKYTEASSFYNCSNLVKVTLPSTIKSIKNYSFSMTGIENINIPEGCESISVGALESNKLTVLTIPKSVTKLGFNAYIDDTNQYEIMTGSVNQKIRGYKGSAAEEYSLLMKKIFLDIEIVPLTDIILPEEITVNINERTEIPLTFTPKDSYVGFHKADEYSLTGNGNAVIEITEDGKVYITATEVGQDNLILTKYEEFRYIDNNITSNVCKINIVDPSIIDATSITLKDVDNNAINNTTVSYDTYETGYTYPLTVETNPFNANEDIIFSSTNENTANVSLVDGKYVLNLSHALILTPRNCTITATGKRSGVTTSFDVSVFYGGAASIKFDTSFSNNKDGKINRVVQNSEYTMPIKVNPTTLVNDSTVTIVQNPQTMGETVITYDKSTSKLKALGAGTATITAGCRGQSVSYDFAVLPYENKAISVTVTTNDKVAKTDTGYKMALNVSDTYQLSATVLPEDTTDILKWYPTTNNGVISSDNQGNIVALQEGTATIKAYSCSYLEEGGANAQSEYVTITVTDPNKVVDNTPEVILAKDIQLGQTDCQMNVGEKLQLTTTLTPSNTTEKPTFKSSDTSIAKVSDKGLVTIVGKGTVNIIAQIRGMLDILEITVKAPIIPPILSLSSSSITLKKGEPATITGTITGKTNVTSIIWNVEDGTMASITENGEITAKAVGSTRIEGLIYCFDTREYYRTYCTLIITEDTTTIPTTPTPPSTPTSPVAPATPTTPTTVQGIAMNATSLVLDYGDANTLVAALYPQGVAGTVSWASNNEGVAVVSNGLVVAKGPGTCQIVASCNGITATSNVTVNPGTIQLNAGKFNLQKGKTTKALIVRASSYENDNIVSVTSSNSKILKASVSNNQISLKGIKTSSKYITVKVETESGASASCQVKVVKDKVTTSKLILNKKTVTISKGSSETLAVTQTPISSTDKLTWTSSNKKVVTVDKNGKIVAKKKGKATITLKSSNGKKVTCKVTVK